VKRLFSAADFGGWTTINATFFGNGGLWDRLFKSTR
jgi:ABC-type sulfate transport system substrate-binding protein